MALDNPKFDVAISFLSKDLHTAAALCDKLSEALNVFFFPRKQEDLAGTDGMESMRQAFYDDSRVMVVLYGDGWGKTPWTRVEETAIKEACLEFGWERLFFLVLDQSSSLPKWLPRTHVRFNYAEYGLNEAVGAIKARAQELGGRVARLTPAKRAEILRAEERFLEDKAQMNSERGLRKIVAAVRILFSEIEGHCSNLGANKQTIIRCEIDFLERQSVQMCVITNDEVSLTVVWNQPYTNILDGSGLVVREFDGRLILPSETIGITSRNLEWFAKSIIYQTCLSPANTVGNKRANRNLFLQKPLQRSASFRF